MSVPPALINQAVAAAAEVLGHARPVTLPPVHGDLSGRVRQLAGAAMATRGWPACDVAPTVHVNRIQLCASQLARRGLTATDLAAVQAALDAAGAPRRTVGRPRNPRGWTDPRRDLDREARIIKRRRDGEGLTAIAEAEKVAISGVSKILNRETWSTPQPRIATEEPCLSNAPR